MTKRIVLHVGPPKTGTKSIQAALSANRDALLEDGVYYPDTRPAADHGHPCLAWDILEDLGRTATRWSDSYVSWPTVLTRAEQDRVHTILLSSEGFATGRFDGAALAHLRMIVGDRPVMVVFGLRDPCRLIPSAWQQMVKSCIGDGQEYQSLEDAAKTIAAWPWIQVEPYIASVLAALRPTMVRFFTVPPGQDHQALMRRFGEAAMLPRTILDRLCAQRQGVANEGLSAQQAAVLLRINQCQVDAAPEWSCAGNASKDSFAFRALLFEALSEARGDRGAASTLSPIAHETAARIGERIIGWIGAEQFHVAGDLDDLQSTKPPSGEPPAIDEQAVAAGALRLLLQVGRLALGREQSALAYLKEVEKARDWWHAQSDAWQSAAQR